VNASLVLVPVTVVDRKGTLLTGLAREDFVVFEDKEPQRIVAFTKEDVPVSLGIVFDMSGSMKQSLSDAKAVLQALLQTANEDDEAFLMTVSTQPRTSYDFTHDVAGLGNSILSELSGGSTALIDTAYDAISHMHRGRNVRKAIVIVSDGMDNHSRYSSSELLQLAVESDVAVYTIGLWTVEPNKKPIELGEQGRGMLFLEELARKTGGLHASGSSVDMIHAAAAMGRAMRSFYVIGYAQRHSISSEDGKWRGIQVRSTIPDALVYARPGYYSR
jgi:Ca-activated chloride channel family protein